MVIGALASTLGSITAATAPYWAAIQGGMSLYSGYAQSRSLKAQGNAVKSQYDYNAQVAEYDAQQQLYNAESNAAVALQNARKTADEQGLQEASDKRKFDFDQAAIVNSIAARNVDVSGPGATDLLRSHAIEFEKEVQRQEYVTGQKEANFAQEARLQDYYGNAAATRGRTQAGMLRAEGAAEKAAYDAKAGSAMRSGIVSAATSFASYFKSPLPNQSPILPGGGGTTLSASANPIYTIGTKRYAIPDAGAFNV